MIDRRREIRDAYDEIARPHDENRRDDPPELALLGEFVADLPAGASVLDAGCGAGEPIGTFLAEHADVTGLDFSQGQLALARERLPDAPLVQADMTALPFADDSFDGIVAIYSVIHVPWERHADVFAEFHRVARPGAPVLVTVGTSDWEGTAENWMGWGADMHWEIPGVERTAELLTAAGFSVAGRTRVRDDFGEEAGYKAFVRARA